MPEGRGERGREGGKREGGKEGGEGRWRVSKERGRGRRVACKPIDLRILKTLQTVCDCLIIVF